MSGVPARVDSLSDLTVPLFASIPTAPPDSVQARHWYDTGTAGGVHDGCADDTLSDLEIPIDVPPLPEGEATAFSLMHPPHGHTHTYTAAAASPAVGPSQTVAKCATRVATGDTFGIAPTPGGRQMYLVGLNRAGGRVHSAVNATTKAGSSGYHASLPSDSSMAPVAVVRPRQPPHAKAFSPFLSSKDPEERVQNADAALAVFPELHKAFGDVCASALSLRQSLDAAVNKAVKLEAKATARGARGGCAAVESMYMGMVMGFFSEVRRDPGPVLSSLADEGERARVACEKGPLEDTSVLGEVQEWRREVTQCTDGVERLHRAGRRAS